MERIHAWIKRHNAVVHNKGCIVLGAPGIGKTTFAESHKEWIDADDIFGQLGIHTMKKVDGKSEAALKKHYLECDKWLKLMRDAGLWIIGSLFWEFKADYIVQLNVTKHKSYVDKRDDLEWSFVQDVRKVLDDMAKKYNITVFSTIKKVAQTQTRLEKYKKNREDAATFKRAMKRQKK